MKRNVLVGLGLALVIRKRQRPGLTGEGPDTGENSRAGGEAEGARRPGRGVEVDVVGRIGPEGAFPGPLIRAEVDPPEHPAEQTAGAARR